MWEIKAHTRIGPLALGMTTDQAIAILGEEYDTFNRTEDAGESVYAFDSNGVHLTCDPEGVVRIVSVFRPNEVYYNRVQLVGRPVENVLNELNSNGITAAREDAGYWIGQAGVLIVEVEGFVDGVELYPD